MWNPCKYVFRTLLTVIERVPDIFSNLPDDVLHQFSLKLVRSENFKNAQWYRVVMVISHFIILTLLLFLLHHPKAREQRRAHEIKWGSFIWGWIFLTFSSGDVGRVNSYQLRLKLRWLCLKGWAIVKVVIIASYYSSNHFMNFFLLFETYSTC